LAPTADAELTGARFIYAEKLKRDLSGTKSTIATLDHHSRAPAATLSALCAPSVVPAGSH